jgi:hypothetical protein
MTDDDFSETDVPKGFSVISWYRSIPLCDDIWIGMQAQHIAAVEIAIIRPLELHTARKIFNEEGYLDVMLALNGVSQMWLFSLYEFLRTWRQRATQLLQLADQYARTLPRKQKAFLAKTIADAKAKEKHVFSGASFSPSTFPGLPILLLLMPSKPITTRWTGGLASSKSFA